VVMSRQVAIEKVGFIRYKYGSVDIRKVPILRSSKFVVVDGHGGSMVDMSLDDVNLVPSTAEIPAEGAATPLTFLLPNGVSLSLAEMAMITMADEIADELYSYEGSSERMRILSTNVEQNPRAFTTHGNVIIQGIDLAKDEVKKRKAKVSHSSNGHFVADMERQVRKVQRLLRNSGSRQKNLPPLTSLLSSHGWRMTDGTSWVSDRTT